MKNIALIITFIFLFFSCKNENKEKESQAEKVSNRITLNDIQIKNAGISIGKIEQKQISEKLLLNGKIDVPPQNLVSISVPMGGYLKNINLLIGMYVKKGQILCNVEDKQYIQLQEDYLISKSKLAFAKTEYERQKELNQSKASSDKVYQQSVAEYNSLVVMVESFAEKLKFAGINPNAVSPKSITKNINIYSPIDGYISKINVNIGKYVNPSDILFEIVNISDIHLALTVYEKDINKLSIGQSLFASTNSEPNNKHLCKIILIGKDFTENKSSVIHCHFDKYDKALLPGMYMNATVELKTKLSKSLPNNAIVNFENKNYIFVTQKNKQFEMVEITTGNTENDFTEIQNASQFVNKNIVINGSYALLMEFKNSEEEE